MKKILLMLILGLSLATNVYANTYRAILNPFDNHLDWVIASLDAEAVSFDTGANTQVLYVDNNTITSDAGFTYTKGSSTVGVSGDINIGGNNLIDVDVIYGDSSYVRIGDAATTQYGFTDEDDLMVTGNFEVNKTGYYTGVSNYYGRGAYRDLVAATFGNSTDAGWQWYSGGTNHFLQLATRVATAATSGYIFIVDYDSKDDVDRRPSGTVADPTLRIYSSDATEANDYIEFYHNQTDAYIRSGTGTINLDDDNLTTMGSAAFGAAIADRVRLFAKTTIDDATSSYTIVESQIQIDGDSPGVVHSSLKSVLVSNPGGGESQGDGAAFLSSQSNQIFIQGSGTIGTLNNIDVRAFAISTSTDVTNLAGYCVRNPLLSSYTGTISNIYGLLIESLKETEITNAWGVYQEGTDDVNYFAGKSGFGTMTPAVTVEVSGDARIGDGTANYVSVSVSGDIVFVGDSGFPYGSIWQDESGNVIVISAISVDVSVDGFTTGETHLMVVSGDEEFLIQRAGRYLANWNCSFALNAGNNNDVGGSVGINNVRQSCASAHRRIGTGTDTGDMGSTGIFDLAVDDVVQLLIRNETGINDVLVDHANLTLTLIGG